MEGHWLGTGPAGDGSMAIDLKIHYRCYKCGPNPPTTP